MSDDAPKLDEHRAPQVLPQLPWAAERARALAQSARMGWQVACVALALVLVEGAALAALYPLHPTQRFTLEYDAQNGFAHMQEGTHLPGPGAQRAMVQPAPPLALVDLAPAVLAAPPPAQRGLAPSVVLPAEPLPVPNLADAPPPLAVGAAPAAPLAPPIGLARRAMLRQRAGQAARAEAARAAAQPAQ
jgi:hypothetical protein